MDYAGYVRFGSGDLLAQKNRIFGLDQRNAGLAQMLH